MRFIKAFGLGGRALKRYRWDGGPVQVNWSRVIMPKVPHATDNEQHHAWGYISVFFYAG